MFIDFREREEEERGKERERETDRQTCGRQREKSVGCLLYMPHPEIEPRYVP